MPSRTYIETTIPSFYFEERGEPENVARRNWTRDWWDRLRSRFELVTSVAVLEELDRAPQPKRSRALALLAEVPLVRPNEAVTEIVEVYVRRMVMPEDPGGDALHLALASYYNCAFLLTWNCRHLANANKFEHIRRVNTLLGLTVPSIVTPVELLDEGGTR